MPVLDVYNLKREKVGDLELDAAVFNVEVREHLFHEVVRAQLAARRVGTAKTKPRNQIRGSNAKVWRQKGTGRARHGDRKAPIWVGGGTVFGPNGRAHGHKVNKRTRRAALCAALSRRQQEGRLIVLEDFELPAVKTRQVAEVLSTFEADKTLIVDVENAKLSLSARNLPDSHFIAVGGLNVYDVLRHDQLMVTRSAVEVIEGRLAS